MNDVLLNFILIFQHFLFISKALYKPAAIYSTYDVSKSALPYVRLTKEEAMKPG